MTQLTFSITLDEATSHYVQKIIDAPRAGKPTNAANIAAALIERAIGQEHHLVDGEWVRYPDPPQPFQG